MKFTTIILLLFCIGPLQANRPMRTWEKEDKMALSITNKESATLDGLTKKIKSFRTDNWGRFRIAFRWVAEHIVYDVISYKTNNIKNQSAQEVLKGRRAVCAGYAELLKTIAIGLGIKTEVITGYAKQRGICYEKLSKTHHAWNAAEFDGSWYLFDATWAAGGVDEKDRFRKGFVDFYFAPAPEELLFNHLPSDSRWQLVADTLSRGEFESRCSVNVTLFKLGLTVGSIKKICPTFQCRMVDVNSVPLTNKISKAEIPFEKVLTAGTAYSFAFHASADARFYIENKPSITKEKVIVLYEDWIKVIPYKKNGSAITFTPQPGDLSITMTENGRSETIFAWTVNN